MSAPAASEIDYAAPFAWPADTSTGWTDFFRLWDPHVFTACRNFQRQAVDADDIAQDVRLAVVSKYRDLKTFDTNARFASFLRLTTRGLCLNQIARRRDSAPLPPELPDRPQWGPALDEFFDFIPDHVAPGARIAWLVGQAAEADRPILTLVLLEQLTFVEIGKQLGIVASTAHDRYSAALIRLRQRFRRAPQ